MHVLRFTVECGPGAAQCVKAVKCVHGRKLHGGTSPPPRKLLRATLPTPPPPKNVRITKAQTARVFTLESAQNYSMKAHISIYKSAWYKM